MSACAPVVLFVFNRPDHTERTIEALSCNELAADTDLYVYSDAPRRSEEIGSVAEVRALFSRSWGFKSITVIERSVNVGLAHNIIEGVSAVVEKHGRVVVLEDDLVTSKNFLRYMNDALDLYEDDGSVGHVSGYTYPIDVLDVAGDTFFLRVPMCWGWGTWSREWSSFSRDLNVMDSFGRRDIREFNFSGSYNYWSQLVLNRSGKIKTWFVFWYAVNFRLGRLSVFPKYSLVQNVGHDGSGVHCDSSSRFAVSLHLDKINVERLEAKENLSVVRAHERYFRTSRGSILARLIRRMRSLVRR